MNPSDDILNIQLVDAIHRGLLDDAFYQAMTASVAGDERTREQAMHRYFDYAMRDAIADGRLLLSTNGPVGASIWSLPKSASQAALNAANKQAFITQQMGETSWQTYLKITDFMSEAADGLLSPDAWYLSILALAPEMQGRGLGAAMVQPVLDEADRLGVPSYLETFSERNKRFYSRLGYQDAAIIHEPSTQCDYTIMVRLPLKPTS